MTADVEQLKVIATDCYTNHQESQSRILLQAAEELGQLRAEVKRLSECDEAYFKLVGRCMTLEEENERLKTLVAEKDGQLGRQACRFNRCVKYAELNTEVALWNKLATQHGAEIERLRAENEQLRALLVEAADDLEVTYNYEYPGREMFLDSMRRYQRDMDLVVRMRAALRDEGEKGK